MFVITKFTEECHQPHLLVSRYALNVLRIAYYLINVRPFGVINDDDDDDDNQLYKDQCKKTYQFKIQCKDDMMISDI